MNRLSDIIEMGGNLYEEAWNNGRREALREINCGKFEMLEEANRGLGEQIDSYEKIRLTQDEEIHRLTEKVRQLDEENSLLDKTVKDLREKLEWADAKVKEQNEALAIYRVPTPRNCPFCGGRPDVVAINKERWVVTCHSDTCAVNPETDAFDTIEEAVSAWNHRAGGLTCDWR